jgi:hypothetical protein
VAAVVVLAALAGALFAVMTITGDDDGAAHEVTGSSSDKFTLAYPDGWKPIPEKRLSKLPGKPLAVIRRDDGKGFVVLRREKQAPRDFKVFSAQLTGALKARVPDFQKQSSRVVRIRAGEAFFYSYIRRKAGTVHSVVVVPAGKRSYALNTISRGGSEQVARETARIILSFDLKG